MEKHIYSILFTLTSKECNKTLNAKMPFSFNSPIMDEKSAIEHLPVIKNSLFVIHYINEYKKKFGVNNVDFNLISLKPIGTEKVEEKFDLTDLVPDNF